MMRLLFLFTMMIASQYSYGALYQCKNKNNEIEFKDIPCMTGSDQIQLEKDKDARGFKLKYFEDPGYKKFNPKCVGGSCYCGGVSYNTSKNKERLLRSSAYELYKAKNRMDEYLSSYYEYKKFDTLIKVQEQSCLIRMHQKIFNDNYYIYSELITKMEDSRGRVKGEEVVCSNRPASANYDSSKKYKMEMSIWKECKHNRDFQSQVDYDRRKLKDYRNRIKYMERQISVLEVGR